VKAGIHGGVDCIICGLRLATSERHVGDCMADIAAWTQREGTEAGTKRTKREETVARPSAMTVKGGGKRCAGPGRTHRSPCAWSCR
jgi:hypothetical protein